MDSQLHKERFLESANEALKQLLDEHFDGDGNNNTSNGDINLTTRPQLKKLSSTVDKRDRQSKGQLPPAKTFENRDSLLTELLENPHIRSIYHIMVAVFILIILSATFHDIAERSYFDLNLSLFFVAFGKLPIVMYLWCVMFVSTLVLYGVYQCWANTSASTTTDILFATVYTVYMTVFFFAPLHYLYTVDLPIASSFIIVCEQVRMIMKVHSFVRENAERTLRVRGADGSSDELLCPDFGRYLYFLFAPTLIYRDDYPRREKIDWSFVGANFLQVFGCVYYVSFLMSHFCIPLFEDFNRSHVGLRRFFMNWSGCIVPGSLVFLSTFFCILHSWLNAFAELLRFGDRMFYRDWWNSTSFPRYYRTWNVVVHDWLYAYIYTDLLKTRRSNALSAKLSVFLLSALVHEYIVIVVLRFFYPAMFAIFFLGGVCLMFFFTANKNSPIWNVIMWVALFSGNGLLMCLYTLEHFARTNCPAKYDNFILSQIVPRSWTC